MDIYIIYHIRDFMYGMPKNNYDKIVLYLKQFYHPVCNNSNCKFRFKYSLFDGEILSLPLLIRKSHKKCENCNDFVSDHDHNVCYKCATEEYPIEFTYHHLYCNN